MDDTGPQPPICPCGFWGSPQTLNLCSKCYKDELQRTGKLEDKNKAVNNVDKSDLRPSKSDDIKDSSASEQDNKSELDSKNSQSVRSETGSAAQSDSLNDTNDKQELESSSNDATENKQQDISTDRPVQKNRKRCWTCKAKLELAQRELGICKCSYVFCQLHRLPEQHSCVFDHKESGRKEAREKMVSPGPRKVGRSFQRMDE